MNEFLSDPVPAVTRISLFVLSVGMLLSFVRLVRGPSLPDRVVALDLMATLVMGVIALYCILTGEPALLRAATVLALINFVATVAFARYVEKRSRP